MGELLRDAAARGDSDQVVKLLGEGVKPSYDELNACRRKEQFPFGESMWDPVPCHIQDVLYRVVHDCYNRCYCAGGRNALHIAASSGHADVVAALVLSRWDVNAQDAAGYTPIQRAAAEGHLEVVKQLIKHGANVNVQDKVHGNTALHEASWKGYSKCVQALCEANKVNLQIKNFGGFAPLHLACQNGHNQSCRELLMANCNPNIQNNYGDTPLHTSARYGHAGVTRILISADCHMSDQNKNGDTALHITAAMGRRKLTRILLEAGCDPNRRNKQSERARDIAIRKDLSEIVEIIDKTVPVKQKDRHKERKENEKKRGKNESGSSKESSTRPKDKKKHKNEHHALFGKILDPKWSPYGCHYYPDPQTFPKPKLDSLPQEPLKKGEQYYLDLAGNIRKGPVGVGYTCYCAPFFRHMEERLDRDKKELKEHIDAAHIRLDKKVSNLENKSRGQLNEITRSMALERFKCQQRHLHLEQWLIRGTIFRNSEKVRTSGASPTLLPKSRSLENILEEKTPSGYNHRSVEMLCDRFKSTKDPIIPGDDLKNRSSSREGKESGKGSSEVVGIGTSEGEEDFDRERLKEVQQDRLSNRMNEAENQERKLRRSTREMSERIDDILKNADNADNVDGLYDEMMNWRSYHNYLNKRRSGMCFGEEHNGIERNTANRSSHHNLLKEDGSPSGERRIRRLSDPRGAIEEPERKSVQEIVAKLQKQQTVQELVAKIQRKTGLIHKSAQKWKESKSKNKENCPGNHYPESKKKEYPGPEEMPADASATPNYENVRRWDVPQESLSQLPYGCRSGIYSSAKDPDEYQRNLYMLDPDPPNGKGLIDQDFPRQIYNPREDVYYGGSENYPGKSYHDIGPGNQAESGPYKISHDRHHVGHGRLDMVQRGMRNTLDQPHPSYSPTQNDSGYSTKPYGGSSTGPSPSLSGQEYEVGSTEMKLPPPFLGRKRMDPPSSSLV